MVPSPPPYTSFPLDYAFASPSYPRRWSVDHFCERLHKARNQSSCLGIISCEYRRTTDWSTNPLIQYESVLFAVVPLRPYSNDRLENAVPMYVEVGRSKARGTLCGPALDTVIVHGHSKDPLFTGSSAYSAKALFALSWSTDLPNFLDVFDAIQLLGMRFPNYDVIFRKCSWFSRAVFHVLKSVYRADQVVWKGLMGWENEDSSDDSLMPRLPSFLLSFCSRKRHLTSIARSLGNRNDMGTDWYGWRTRS